MPKLFNQLKEKIHVIPLSRILFLLILTGSLLSVFPVIGKEISSANIELLSNNIEHISFSILRNITIDISGDAIDQIELMVLDPVNYESWVNQTQFYSLLNVNISGKFEYKLELHTSNSTTIHVLFINSSLTKTSLTYTINSRDETHSSLALSTRTFIVGLGTLGIIQIYRRQRATHL